MRKNELLEAINNINARSAWNKGVKIYAYELVESLEVEEIPQDKTELKSLLLNGAADWKQYSWGVLSPESAELLRSAYGSMLSAVGDLAKAATR
mgnify:CR=1 FL=1